MTTTRRPRLLLDLTPLDTPARPRGIGRYIRDLALGLSALPQTELGGLSILGLTSLGFAGKCTLTEAIAEINRYRPGRIILTNAALGARIFNARFRIENIDGVVGQIQQVFGASATSLPGGIVLLG